MIPKKLHYLWIGPYKDNRTFVDDWHQVMPDYELYRWENDNTDPYIEEAIELFGGLDNLKDTPITYVTDLIRVLIVRDHGGLYVDHDIAILKDLTPLLENKEVVMTFMYDPEFADSPNVWQQGTPVKEFTGEMFAKARYYSDTINNCFFAAEKNHPVILRTIEAIVENHFRPENEQYAMSDWCNGAGAFSEVAREMGISIDRSTTVEKDNIIIYERDLLHPVDSMERMRIGNDNFNQKIERLIAEKQGYAVHAHDLYGTDLYFTNKMIFFDEWYKSR